MRQLSINQKHMEVTMRTMAYLLFLLGIAASEPARLLAWMGIEISFAVPLHPMISAVQIMGEAVNMVGQVVR